MQTALHITSLVAQLRQEIVGGTLVSTEFYKKLRSAYFFVKNGRSRVALGFVYHPAGSGSFCVPASKVRLDTREKPWPIFDLVGAVIREVSQLGLDRIFELQVEKKGEQNSVVFEVHGPNGNLWYLDDQRGRKGTLRKRQYRPGEVYQAADSSDRLSPFEVGAEQIVDRLKAESEKSPLSVLKSMLLGFNETMIREALSRADMAPSDLRSPELPTATKFSKAIADIAGRFNEAHSGYLYDVRGGIEVYPLKLVSRDVQPQKFKTMSLAIMEMVDRRQSDRTEADEEKRISKAVGRRVKRHEKLVGNLAKDVERAAGYEGHKIRAELLQLNRERLKKGLRHIEVEDVLSSSHEKVVIELNPKVSPNINIDNYYQKYRKGKEGLDLLRRRLAIVTDELTALRSMQDDLAENFESARHKYSSELLSLLPLEPGSREIQPRLPYRTATLSTGLTIFIGRDGADNDRTTFDFARPYELWFHAQQCAGSHVVMKFPNRSFVPTKREIEETAAIAAFYSKAKHDSMVPVIYTQRRFVRKPRKAKPGLVTVERESSIMVVPKKEISSP